MPKHQKSKARIVCTVCGHSKRIGRTCHSPICQAIRRVNPRMAYEWRVRAYVTFVCGKLAAALLEHDQDKDVERVCERILRWQQEAFADMGPRFQIPESYTLRRQQELLGIMHGTFGDEGENVGVWSTAYACLLMVQDIQERIAEDSEERRIYNWLECAMLALVRLYVRKQGRDPMQNSEARNEAHGYYDSLRAAIWQEKFELEEDGKCFVVANRMLVIARTRREAREYLLRNYGLVFKSSVVRGLAEGTKLVTGDEQMTAGEIAATYRVPSMLRFDGEAA